MQAVSSMQALSSLVREHRFIARLVGALESYSSLVRRGADVDPADLLALARALRQYADEMHREKEEYVLLPFLVRHGFDWQSPPLSRVREEHSHERDLIAALEHAGARIERWTDENRLHVTALAGSLCALQRQHHQTENEHLFPAVTARLDPVALGQLEAELERFDRQSAHVERRTVASDIGEDLIVRYAALEDVAP
jgi:hemerythrin-like domain-containing protein